MVTKYFKYSVKIYTLKEFLCVISRIDVKLHHLFLFFLPADIREPNYQKQVASQSEGSQIHLNLIAI